MDKDYSCLKNYSTALMEQCGDFVLFLDPKFEIIKLNSIAQSMLGISKYKATGYDLFEICKSNRIKLSFTKDDLKNKKIKNKFFSGYILYSLEKKRHMLWKYSFVNNPRQKSPNCFLILGKDISALENTKKNTSLTQLHLGHIIENLPEYIYWKDSNLIYRGCNKHVADYLGLSSSEAIIGKTDKDFGWSAERINNLCEIDKKIIETGIPNIVEDVIPKPDKSERVMLSSKTPLRDTNNNIIGIVGISVDITDSKKAKTLQIEKDRLNGENELHKQIIFEQKKFKKIVDQAVHDIRSPLASLLMIVKSYETGFPEAVRIILREAAISIGDIANNLLSKYRNDTNEEKIKTEERQSFIVALTILQTLSDKKYHYKELPVKFLHDFCPNSNFVFIHAELIAFKRMLSNIINNAVDSMDGENGIINLRMELDRENIQIIIQDNGKGMPQEVIDKITNNIAITSGKKNGNGIGLMQVSETLQRNQGKITINSKIDKGTEVILTFPKAESPEWIAQEIKLTQGDIVVVLDDDSSIHKAWAVRFKDHEKHVNLKHFTLGKEAINFINSYPKREQIFLLTDFELLKQELDGIQVIKQTDIKRSILVTSHYANKAILDLTNENGIKILPKQLASEVSIWVS